MTWKSRRRSPSPGGGDPISDLQVIQIFARHGAITTGHFVLASGRHSAEHVNMAAVSPHVRAMSLLCRAIAEEFAGDGIEVVIGPATGGVVISHLVAFHLTEQTALEVLALYADKDERGFVIKRGQNKLVFGKRVLVVEDILTTGNSARQVAEAARACGGNVIGLGAVFNRGGVTKESAGVPKLFALETMYIETWDAAECLLCETSKSISTELGHGR